MKITVKTDKWHVVSQHDLLKVITGIIEKGRGGKKKEGKKSGDSRPVQKELTNNKFHCLNSNLNHWCFSLKWLFFFFPSFFFNKKLRPRFIQSVYSRRHEFMKSTKCRSIYIKKKKKNVYRGNGLKFSKRWGRCNKSNKSFITLMLMNHRSSILKLLNLLIFFCFVFLGEGR